jgi:hypothetical protein
MTKTMMRCVAAHMEALKLREPDKDARREYADRIAEKTESHTSDVSWSNMVAGSLLMALFCRVRASSFVSWSKMPAGSPLIALPFRQRNLSDVSWSKMPAGSALIALHCRPRTESDVSWSKMPACSIVIAFVLVCCKFSRAPSRKRDVQAPMLLKTPSLSPLILVREVQ